MQGNLRLEIGKIQRAQHRQRQVDDVFEFVFYLFVRAEDVGVVLRESAYAGQSAQLAGLFVPIDRAKLRVAHGEVPVRPHLVCVDANMMRAIHGFQQKPLFLVAGVQHGRELAFPVVGVVPARLVEIEPSYVRRNDRLVSPFELLFFQKIDERFAQRSAAREPHRQSGAYLFVEGEQFQFPAEFAVVAFGGEGQARQMLVEHAFFRKADAVNARELRAAFVSAPVRARHVEQLDMLDPARRGNVGAAAQIDEVALPIERDCAVFEVFEQFQFVFVALVLKIPDRIRLGYVLPFVRRVARGQFAHPLFDAFQVLCADFAVAGVYVVVESLLNGRSDAEFDAGKQLFERFGHEVRRGMPKGRLSVRVAPGQNLDGGVFVDGAGQVPDFSVHPYGQRLSGEACRNAEGKFLPRNAGFAWADRPVGERNGDVVGRHNSGDAPQGGKQQTKTKLKT